MNITNNIVTGDESATQPNEWLGPITGEVPYNPTVESRTLGALMKQPRYTQWLRPADFHSPFNRNLFAVLFELSMEGAEITPDSVRAELKQRYQLEATEGYLDQLLADPEQPTTKIENDVQTLKMLTLLRDAMVFGHQLACQAGSKRSLRLFEFARKGADRLYWNTWRPGTSS